MEKLIQIYYVHTPTHKGDINILHCNHVLTKDKLKKSLPQRTDV